MSYITQSNLDNWFMYHTPVGDQTDRYQRLRAKGKELAALMVELCPECPDTTTAIRKVREALMTANAAIACYSPAPQEPPS
jgi:hypothetical protein